VIATAPEIARVRQLPFEYALRNAFRGPTRLVASLVGAILVVLLALAAGGFVRGMQQAFVGAEPRHVKVLLLGAGSEEALERSQIDASVAGIAAASIPGIAQVAGTMLVSPEINAALPVRLDADDPRDRQAVFRGVTATAPLVHSEIEIVEGRMPRPGADEIIVGELAAVRLGTDDERLAVGRTIRFDDRDWTVTGRFRAPGTVMAAEIWIPLGDLQIAIRRDGTISAAVLALADDADFGRVDLFAKSRLDLEIAALRESDYHAGLARFQRPIRVLAVITALLVGVGAVLGGLNTMYAAFASRVREIGMLQALGYTRPAIVTSLVEESLLIAGIGTVIGVVVGRWWLEGLGVRFSMGAFTLVLDGPVTGIAIAAGLGLGLVGAIPAAFRCLRLPVPEALRAR